VVELSHFEVTTTQDKGYVTTNAATGFKTNQPLLSIPQAITVVTRDLIEDIGYAQSSDALQFAGVGRLSVGTEGVMLRGNRINNPLIDEFPNGGPPYLDNINIDSYEVIRGPAAVFYINASLGGAILKTTRKPLPYQSTTVGLSADQHGTYRATLDTTGPLGSIGEGKFSYRVDAVYKGGDQFFRNRSEKTHGIFPTLQFNYKDTTVRLAVDYTRLEHYPQAHSFLTPDGQVYTGAGREENYQAPNNLEDFIASQIRFSFLHRFSENWEMKLNAANNRYKRGPTGIILPGGGVNWVTNTITFTARRNYQDFNNNYAMGDISGKYELWGHKSQTIAGFQFAEETSKAGFWGFSTFGGTGSITRPIANPSMDTIVIPTVKDYVTPANPGNKSMRNNILAYVQQQVDIIPERLSAVAGWSRWDRQETSVPNVAAPIPTASTFRKDAGNLHRYGLVGYVTKEISIYALESTVLQPNTFGKLADGSLLPNQIGKGQEVGIKTALFGGRVSGTLSFFDIELSNQTSFGGVLPSGENYFNLIGSTLQKGWDMDIEVKLLPNWQVVGTYFNGDNKTATGAPVSLSYESSWSVFTRYDFVTDGLKGLSIGGGATSKGGWIVGSGGLTLPTPKAFIEMKDPTVVNAFINYAVNRHWSVRVNVENVMDKVFPAGLQAAWLIDPSNPRTFAFSSTYKF
jgi:iron complex outermembrane receptor protein